MMDATSSDGRAEGDPNSQGALERDSTMLVDMLEESTIWSLTKAFAKTNNIAIGVFTPDGVRLGGEPEHHCLYCKFIYSSPQGGRQACDDCDRDHMPEDDQIVKPYRCHANLLDFSVPIVARRENRPVLIGAMFAGQLRPTEHMSEEDIEELRSIAEKYGLDFDALLAKYDARPYFDEERVKRIQYLMKALADTIGQMVTRRYEQHSLMQQLSRMGKPEDVTVAIADFMGADACSMFTQNVGEKGRIYLRATSFEPLQRDIGKAFYEGGEGLTGWVYKKNRTLNVPKVDVPKALEQIDAKLNWASKVLDVPSTESIRAFIAVPIRDDQRRCVGVIRAVRVDGGKFSPLQQETFEAIADMAGRIVELARSQEERQIILSVAKGVLAGSPLEEVIESSMKQAMRLFEHCADNIWITCHRPAERQFEIVDCYQASEEVWVGQEFREDRGIAGWMLARRGEMLFSNNLTQDGIKSIVESVKACMVYPIMSGEEFFGIFTVASSRTDVFTDNDKKQLQLLGAQVTAAFENARHFEQTRKEQDTLRKYCECLNEIAKLSPPWEPRSVAKRVCRELQSLGFARICAEVRDGMNGEEVAVTWEKTPGVDGYRELEAPIAPVENPFILHLCKSASGDKVTATVELSPREGESAFTGIDEMCLRLAERLAAGRLRDEADLASTVTTSIGASSHGLRGPVTGVHDKIDGILHGSELSLSESVRSTLQNCQEKLEYVLEWCETSELLTQYRRGSCPKEDEFTPFRMLEDLPSVLEICQGLGGWQLDKDDVPPGTLVKVHLKALRRIIGDLVRNAEEHGVRDGLRKVALTLVKQAGRDRARVAVSNEPKKFAAELAADLQEKAKTPERMAFDSKFGIGLMLAAVIAKMHGGSLEVEVQGNLVTFSFTLPVCTPRLPSVS